MATLESLAPEPQALDVAPDTFEQSDHLISIARDVGGLLLNRGIPFRVWSGVQAAEIGRHRVSQDVDFWMPDGQIETAYHILRQHMPAPVSLDERHDRYIIRIGDHDDVEIMARMDIHASDGKVYPLRMSRNVIRQSHPHIHMGKWAPLPFAAPEETILLKAILQRGEEQDKHDAEDIVAMRRNLPWINVPYLTRRSFETESYGRVMPFLQACGITLPSDHNN